MYSIVLSYQLLERMHACTHTQANVYLYIQSESIHEFMCLCSLSNGTGQSLLIRFSISKIDRIAGIFATCVLNA